jgi:toxin YoeB
MALRISDLIYDILRSPFDGIGKPEALKHNLKAIGADVLTRNID